MPYSSTEAFHGKTFILLLLLFFILLFLKVRVAAPFIEHAIYLCIVGVMDELLNLYVGLGLTEIYGNLSNLSSGKA